MKTVLNITAGLMMALGLIAMAGSANDCGGACMEQANTIGEMITIALLGLAAFGTGAAILITNEGSN